MTLQLPQNTNFLNPQNFKLVLKRAPLLEFFAIAVRLPDLMLMSVDIGTQFVPIKTTETHVSYSQMTVQFLVDEQLNNYNEIYDWINRRGFPVDYNQYRSISSQKQESGRWLDSDISVLVENSNHKAVGEFTLIDAHPTSLSGIQLNTTDNDIRPASATVVFDFTRLTFDQL